jgi:excisionase family DNA binding protein
MDRAGGRSRKCISVDDAARELGISRSTAYLCCARGELPCIRIAGRILVLRDAFEQLLAGNAAPREREKAALVGNAIVT